MPLVNAVLRTTENLTLRSVRHGDIDQVSAMYRDSAVNANLPGGPWTGPDVPRLVDRVLRDYEKHWSEHGFGPWAVQDRQSGRFAGISGLRFVPEELKHPNKRGDGSAEVELLAVFNREYWSLGYAYEAAKEALRFGYCVKGFEQIIALSVEPSPRIESFMKRLHLGYQGDRPMMFSSMAVYSLTRNRWILGEHKPLDILKEAG